MRYRGSRYNRWNREPSKYTKLHGMFVIVMLMALAPGAKANYERTSKATATVCSGFVIEKCSTATVLALEKEGKYFELKTRFDSVEDYRADRTGSKNGTCSIKPSFLNRFQVLHKDTNGEKILNEPDYLVFSCRKTD